MLWLRNSWLDGSGGVGGESDFRALRLVWDGVPWSLVVFPVVLLGGGLELYIATLVLFLFIVLLVHFHVVLQAYLKVAEHRALRIGDLPFAVASWAAFLLALYVSLFMLAVLESPLMLSVYGLAFLLSVVGVLFSVAALFYLGGITIRFRNRGYIMFVRRLCLEASLYQNERRGKTLSERVRRIFECYFPPGVVAEAARYPRRPAPSWWSVGGYLLVGMVFCLVVAVLLNLWVLEIFLPGFVQYHLFVPSLFAAGGILVSSALLLSEFRPYGTLASIVSAAASYSLLAPVTPVSLLFIIFAGGTVGGLMGLHGGGEESV